MSFLLLSLLLIPLEPPNAFFVPGGRSFGPAPMVDSEWRTLHVHYLVDPDVSPATALLRHHQAWRCARRARVELRASFEELAPTAMATPAAPAAPDAVGGYWPEWMAFLSLTPLPEHADRLLFLAGRRFADFAIDLVDQATLGLLGDATGSAGVFGAVDELTGTRGFVIAEGGTLSQITYPPGVAICHELWHLLGCEHDHGPEACAARIQSLKDRHDGRFFPAHNLGGEAERDGPRMIRSRQEADCLQLATLGPIDRVVYGYHLRCGPAALEQ